MIRRAGDSSLLAELNDAQREAVTTVEGPLLVLAGAGTGKTRVITYRIVHLLRMGYAPESILGVTFTNKAAREMRERVTALLGKRIPGLTLSTFHSLGVRILRAEGKALGLKRNFTILDSSDQISLLKDIIRDQDAASSMADIRSVAAAISLAKNRFAMAEELADTAEDNFEQLVAQVYGRYEQRLRLINCVDFDDLILLPVRLAADDEAVSERLRHRFRHVMVDEYQDTNGVQYRLTSRLVGPERNLCVVGDDDQSIYGFRGAEMDKILRFEREFPGAKVVKLEENYRSTRSILSLANSVIAQNSLRHEKALRSNLGEGQPVKWVTAPDGDAEVDYVVGEIQDLAMREQVPYEHIAVLLRSSFLARSFEERLRLRGIPYTLVGGQSYFDRKEIRDLLAYFNVAHNSRDELSLLRIINFPRRGFGSTSLERLLELARAHNTSAREALKRVVAGEGQFTAAVRESARFLVDLFDRAKARIRSGDYAAMAEGIVEAINYKVALRELYPEAANLQARWNAVEDLLRSLKEWQLANPGARLAEFLGALSLDGKGDRSDSEEKLRGVALMTLHSAKGLEFPQVFLVGVEEDLLPHHRSVVDGDRAIEEERRLFYVGVTRARERLIVTSASHRSLRGKSIPRLPSRFLTELEDETLVTPETYNPDEAASEERIDELLAAYRKRRETSGS